MWLYGTEEAFTIIPNFLFTGILALFVSLVIIVWSVGFIHSKYGATVFGLLCVLLFLVGGGIAAPDHVCSRHMAGGYGMDGSLTWWRKVLPGESRGC